MQRGLGQLADRDQALRRRRLRQRGGVLRADLGRIDRQLRIPPYRVGRREQLEDRTSRECLANGLRALGKKTPGLATVLAAGEARGRREPGVGRTEQPDQAAGDCAPPVPSAATAARATSTSAANAGPSLTARSASTLRSTVTPASRRPWMN